MPSQALRRTKWEVDRCTHRCLRGQASRSLGCARTAPWTSRSICAQHRRRRRTANLANWGGSPATLRNPKRQNRREHLPGRTATHRPCRAMPPEPPECRLDQTLADDQALGGVPSTGQGLSAAYRTEPLWVSWTAKSPRHHRQGPLGHTCGPVAECHPEVGRRLGSLTRRNWSRSSASRAITLL